MLDTFQILTKFTVIIIRWSLIIHHNLQSVIPGEDLLTLGLESLWEWDVSGYLKHMIWSIFQRIIKLTGKSASSLIWVSTWRKFEKLFSKRKFQGSPSPWGGQCIVAQEGGPAFCTLLHPSKIKHGHTVWPNIIIWIWMYLLARHFAHAEYKNLIDLRSRRDIQGSYSDATRDILTTKMGKSTAAAAHWRSDRDYITKRRAKSQI